MHRLHLGLPVLFVSALVVSACATDLDEDDDESEPTASSESAVISPVDCRTTKMTAYDRGRAYSIDVIKIGGKRVSKPTGHAFLKMQQAAHSAGVRLTLSSGFRTNEEQKYFYNCYKTKKCNGGNLAAKPGYSNHQNGRALDLSTSKWLANNAGKFGFKRTVPSEPWHYEFGGKDPGGPCSASSSPSTTVPDEVDDADETDADETDTDTDDGSASGGGVACTSDGQCNPGNDGSGMICTGGQCVDGCRTNAQCPGTTRCVSGFCQ
ncbi:MAG: D-alanyl-D-alanine carboxypeptidase family protein [Labilithrix sp.]|nr:D-alanyl-D-alanine carboxypeptidase family protein [Labilithrix sp.]